ncbi:hypothetical protein [Rhodopila sp.]|uniref:hypothetical protein n=1 Tax=Rhodopila sp. TaxID=2480087 RepID=UPI003D148F34
MTPADDIKGLEPGTSTEKRDEAVEAPETTPASKPERMVGPESEVRGGPEAPSE